MMKRYRLTLTLILLLLLMSSCAGETATEAPLPEPGDFVSTVSIPLDPTGTPDGQSWNDTPAPALPTVPPPSAPPIEAPRLAFDDLQMIDPSTGFAIIDFGESSNRIMRTRDGGSTWIDITPSGVPSTANRIHFLDANHGWAAYLFLEGEFPSSAYTIWRTTDGGDTWSRSAPINMADIAAEGIAPTGFFFLDAQTGWFRASTGAGMMKTYPTIYRTMDGGQSWTRMMDSYTDYEISSFDKTGMVFADASYGWITRDGHGVEIGIYVQITEDGGATWRSIALPEPTDVEDMFQEGWCGAYHPQLTGRGQGSLMGSCEFSTDGGSTFRSYLYTTTDGGVSWTYVNMPPGELFRFPGTLVQASRTIYQSTDGGENWNRMATVDFSPSHYSFADPLHGWVFAQWENQPASLMRTQNGGSTWEPVDAVFSVSQ